MLKVSFAAEAEGLLRRYKLDRTIVVEALGKPDLALPGKSSQRSVLAKWWSDDRLILIEGENTATNRMGEKNGKPLIQVQAIEVVLAIQLTTNLPAGKIDRSMDMYHIFRAVAESFGEPLSCHRDQPLMSPYNGPADLSQSPDKLLRFRVGVDPERFLRFASIGKTKKRAYAVWAFDHERYTRWFRESGIAPFANN